MHLLFGNNVPHRPVTAHAPRRVDQTPGNAALRLELFPTYGPHGSARPPAIIAGERLDLFLSVSGIAAALDGKADCLIEPELVDSRGNLLIRLPSDRVNFKLCLGGSTFGRCLFFAFPRNWTGGSYLARVRVTDRVKGESAEEELRFEVLPQTAFGAMDLRVSHDTDGALPAGGNLTVGETVHAVFSAAGFAAIGKRVHVSSTLTILDENNKPVVSEPYAVDFDQPAPEQPDSAIPVRYRLAISRAGRFVLRIALTDHVARKTATYDLPITASPPPQQEGEGDRRQK